ncbi:hypothetical protein [Parvibaculum sp.]|jgi:hypothetical protein|uniref:hypothetical protein n=1 Tax=Parvibaculum sp. TaxID=2024848 RepID=UPI000C365919|nr:hypothetical protein [Parvibaculum sp.]MAU59718.1 hypothetical protein [Parvibaculum sp.]MBO6667758.1 hypothetical protein [Parvibaculum sp.]MBO6693162.1 hypothetical protein [Parvibaculum sp.]MBO6715157.1 hypothetical protein [Parvibaculum sp.]|tara:strand:- start:7440 stop:7898 length:459 start_codon:yes stop_codon:yes gene_type:complete
MTADRNRRFPAAPVMENEPAVTRWVLLRDVAVFHGKLVLDGLKDILLSPVSLGAALISLFNKEHETGRQFYEVLHAARRLEDWLNKYGDADRIPAPGFAVKQEGESIDAMIARLEELVKRQYERGGVTANAKDAIDRALDAVHEKLRKRTEW